MSPSRILPGSARGYIVPIGGAEDKLKNKHILRRFVAVCQAARKQRAAQRVEASFARGSLTNGSLFHGSQINGPQITGAQASPTPSSGHVANGDVSPSVRGAPAKGIHLAIIPTASELADTGAHYVALFRDLGVPKVTVLPFENRVDGDRADWLEVLAGVDGVFLTGGNQLRLSTTLGGTKVAQLLRRLNADGVPVAGTSAGAAFMSEHMIAFGGEGPTPRGDMVTLAPGLGLTNRVIIDQHFRQRDRLGRILTALAYNPFPMGIGLDEDTAAFIGPDDVIEVMGSGALTLIDPADMSYSSMDSIQIHKPVCLIGLRLHVLVEGARFDLTSRQASPPPAKRAKSAGPARGRDVPGGTTLRTVDQESE